MKKTSVTVCPVPEDQQPHHEYEDLKDSCFFRWSTRDLGSYGSKLFGIWAGGWIISGPIVAVSFPPSKFPIQFGLLGAAGASIFVVLTLIRLYLGWKYIRDRLFQPSIFYEESGWYDGQTWQKPPEMLDRDRLIVSYELQPILRRIQRTLGLIVLLLTVDILTVWLVFPH